MDGRVDFGHLLDPGYLEVQAGSVRPDNAAEHGDNSRLLFIHPVKAAENSAEDEQGDDNAQSCSGQTSGSSSSLSGSALYFIAEIPFAAAFERVCLPARKIPPGIILIIILRIAVLRVSVLRVIALIVLRVIAL